MRELFVDQGHLLDTGDLGALSIKRDLMLLVRERNASDTFSFILADVSINGMRNSCANAQPASYDTTYTSSARDLTDPSTLLFGLSCPSWWQRGSN
jgi:hypothetical protein